MKYKPLSVVLLTTITAVLGRLSSPIFVNCKMLDNTFLSNVHDLGNHCYLSLASLNSLHLYKEFQSTFRAPMTKYVFVDSLLKPIWKIFRIHKKVFNRRVRM